MINDPKDCNDFVISNPHKRIVTLSGLDGVTIPPEVYNYDLKKRIHIRRLEDSQDLKIAFTKHWLYPANTAPIPSGMKNFDCTKIRRIQPEEEIKVKLIRKLGGVGDVLMTSVVTRAIKEQFPKSHITYAVFMDYYNGALRKLIEHNPYVDRIMDCYGVDNNVYDFCIDLTASDMNYEANHQPRVKKTRIECHLEYAKIWTDNRVPVYKVSETEHELAVEWLKKNGILGKRIVGVELRCNAPNRDYLKFRELVDIILKNTDVVVILFDHLRDKAWTADRVYGCLGQDITLVAALMELCDLFIALDSGLLHLAGALEIPIFAIFGQIDAKMRTKEYKNCTYYQNYKLGCVPCWYRPKRGCNNECLKIEPEVLWEYIKKMLQS